MASPMRQDAEAYATMVCQFIFNGDFTGKGIAYASVGYDVVKKAIMEAYEQGRLDGLSMSFGNVPSWKGYE